MAGRLGKSDLLNLWWNCSSFSDLWCWKMGFLAKLVLIHEWMSLWIISRLNFDTLPLRGQFFPHKGKNRSVLSTTFLQTLQHMYVNTPLCSIITNSAMCFWPLNATYAATKACSAWLIFTARCTLVQSVVLRSYVVCLSICLSVCPWRLGTVIT